MSTGDAQIGLDIDTARGDVRARIIEAAAVLLAQGGRDAVTTRAVASAASVQAPTIYRLFGDKRGLLDAVAEHGLAAYMAGKAQRPPHPDPVQDLRDGWDTHIAFGLDHPGLFAIMSGDPGPRQVSPAVTIGLEVLRARIKRIALAGRLRVAEERALALVQAMGDGAVLTLLNMAEAQRDPGLVEAAREAVIAAIVADTPSRQQAGVAGAAITLRAALPQAMSLTNGERGLMGEWLDRLARSEVSRPEGSEA
ncbi:TetR/AcrR family transcriptional regulator [uncultured Devosia sp.]|uniref:TetR/AcrR family transcriptional regulator n=1 Tax=uncultured Devosia sp. TaxID=211434 RepID=UPI0035CB7522